METESEEATGFAAAITKKPKPFSLNITNAKSSEALLRILAAQNDWSIIIQAYTQPKPPPAHAPSVYMERYRAGLKPLPPPKGNIVWTVAPEALEHALIGRRGDQRISHVPGMHGLCCKVPFSLLSQAHGLDFFPESWIVEPGAKPEPAALSALRGSGTLILKPNDGTQGDGIFLVRSAAELDRLLTRQTQSVVLQRYIAKPMLLPAADGGGGFKFDLRIYALVLRCDPPQFFLCRDGLVRVCSESYTHPSKEGGGTRTSRHLTNYSINKMEAGFEHNTDPSEGAYGTKRSLQPVLEFMQAHAGGGSGSSGDAEADENEDAAEEGGTTTSRGRRGFSAEGTWEQIRSLVGRTLNAMASQLSGSGEEVDGINGNDLWAPPREGSALWVNVTTGWDDPSWGDWRSKCFHLLGIDVMLDERGRAHLLEVNCNPSLGVDAVYTTEGPYAQEPPPPPPSMADLVAQAVPLMKGKGVKVCKCRSHHRPHMHHPCPIDLAVKHSCVGGALSIVARDIAAHKVGEEPSMLSLCEGTSYEWIGDVGAASQPAVRGSPEPKPVGSASAGEESGE